MANNPPDTHAVTESPQQRPEEVPFIHGRLRSFGFACSGVGTLLREQQNAWVHLLASLLVIGLGLWFGITTAEWALLIVAMVLVWTAEALNTGLELVCDLVCETWHPQIKKAKDVAAGAVLLSAIGAALIGLLVFLPYL